VKPDNHKCENFCWRKSAFHGITIKLLKNQKLQENKNVLLEVKEDTYCNDIQMNRHTVSV
jgi:hypothetical protein